MSLFNNWFGKNTTTTNHDPFLDALVSISSDDSIQALNFCNERW